MAALLIKPLELPPAALDVLARYLAEKFQMVVRARQTQLDDKALNWAKNYDAIPDQVVRTTPFYRASNFMPHLIRMHTDILGARTLGILFGTNPFWRVRSLLDNSVPHKVLDDLSTGLNYLWDTELEGFETTDQIVNQSLQTGTLNLKALWSDSTFSYMDPDGNFPERNVTGMQYDAVPFEDFWPFPITARDNTKAEILFHRIRLTERDVHDRVDSGKWDKRAGDLLMHDSRISPIDEARAQSTGISLTKDVDYAYSVIEAWLDYDIGGKRRPIVVQFNPEIQGVESILKAFYNFMPYGRKPFRDFRPMPRRGSYYGYSCPEVLEAAQEEQAQIHNQRRDANTIANIPSFKKLRNADVPNPATDWYPGCVIELDDMGDLEAFGVGTNYNSMMDEEQFLLSLAERYIGISPSMQGFGAGQAAGKRGIYATGATLALLSEGNRRIDIYIKRVRSPFHHLGELTTLAYNQFGSTFFDKFGDRGHDIRQAFQLADPEKGLQYTLTASTASANREIDRQSLLQMVSVLGNYYERIIQATQLMGQLQPEDPVRKVVAAVLDGAHDLADRILFAFDQPDREAVLPNVNEVVGPGGGPAAQPHVPGGLPANAGAVPPSQLANFAQNVRALTAGARQAPR